MEPIEPHERLHVQFLPIFL